MPRSFDISAESCASVEQIHAAYRREDYWLARMAMGHAAAATTLDSLIVDADGTVTAQASQHVARQFPGPIAKLIPGDPKVVSRETWRPVGDGEVHGHVDVTVPAHLGTASAEGRLVPSGSGSQLRYTVTVDVHIPLVGGTIERFLGANVAKDLSKLQQFTTAWIAENT